jgi:hypothetical protein
MIKINPDFSCVRQDHEAYDSLEVIFKHQGVQLKPRFPGDIGFQFKEGDKNKILRFDSVSSTMYCDEILWSYENYPYIYDLDFKTGLYEVLGSSYLQRIQSVALGAAVRDHHHYIYFDREFNWHITARGLEISDA